MQRTMGEDLRELAQNYHRKEEEACSVAGLRAAIMNNVSSDYKEGYLTHSAALGIYSHKMISVESDACKNLEKAVRELNEVNYQGLRFTYQGKYGLSGRSCSAFASWE